MRQYKRPNTSDDELPKFPPTTVRSQTAISRIPYGWEVTKTDEVLEGEVGDGDSSASDG